MIRGVLVAESLLPDVVLGTVPLRVTALVRRHAGDTSAGRPRLWTLLHFEVDDDGLGDALAEPLSWAPTGGWYASFTSPARAHVVFAGRAFSYPRGDRAARAVAVAHGRSAGVPDDQLDWED